ncbi:LacI family DNA-binding transcriptional regulator [Rathayibacter sp. SD072]|uniref:LacI family DNA-binding transcriptional regulator n=1 Tax=Rathayibacter sp. SD072 TaxID=2781731 RepID=UPI001A96F15B|nr:LacI family DNA-binding transcriptional regulator [Rathayibacter sp. SD072]MBO0982660.1 LacI family DNA-binding transcriptional regulator [Rathayibacter sp. SD072]
MTTTEHSGRPATSADVARHAGVSRSTVSNILNGNVSRFPERTRQKVLDSARALDYQPSFAGRSLVSGRSDTIVVLVANAVFAAHFQNAVERVTRNTRQIGGNVVIRVAGESPRATSEAIAGLRPLAVVDFGVLSSGERAWLEDRGTLIVPSIARDQTGTSRDGGISSLQASALLEHQPKGLWFAAPANLDRDPYIPSRYEALQRVAADAGLPRTELLSLDLTVESGISALRAVLATSSTAGIACYNDDVALTLLAAARELGIDVPGTIAVAGVDNSPVGQMWSPRLTTIDTDLVGMVDAIAVELRILLGETELEMPSSRTHFTLVRGESA